VLNVKTGSNFIYTGSSDIVLAEDASNNAGGAVLNLSGGTFTTPRGFNNTTAGTNATATTTFNFSEGGTIKLSAHIPSLFIEGTEVFSVTTGTGGGVIDTNGFNTTVALGMSGAGGLEKKGSGSLTVSENNTYGGNTLVSAGTLLVNGSLGSGAVTVDPLATIGGTGALGGSLSLAGTSLLRVVDFTDPLSVTGLITFGSGFGIANLAGVNWDSLDLETPYTVVATSQSFDATTISNFGRENAVAVGPDRQAFFTSGSLNLVVIPEPSTALLGGLGLLALLRRKRVW
jgi:autotransporter-associated beta strand protein